MPGRVKKRRPLLRRDPRGLGLKPRHARPAAQVQVSPPASPPAPVAGQPVAGPLIAEQPPAAPTVPAPAATTSESSLLSSNTADPRSQIVNKSSLTWLIIICLLVVGALILISWLLCRCRRRRGKDGQNFLNRAGHSHHPSLEVKDGRNDHHAWYRHAPRQLELMDVSRMGTSESITPLAQAAVRHAGAGVYVVDKEDDDDVSPLTTKFRREASGVKPNRYYSGLSDAWKRISQIGRAY